MFVGSGLGSSLNQGRTYKSHIAFFSCGGAINCEPNLLLSKHSDFDVEADRARSMHRLINRNMSFKQRMQQVITHNIDMLRWVRACMPGQVFERFGYLCTCA